MNPIFIILAVGAVGVTLLLVWGPVRAGLAKQDLRARCAAKKAELALLQTQGQDLGTRLVVQSELEECQDALRDAGIEVDDLAELLDQISGLRQRIRQEDTHYRSTDWIDGVKRGNTFGAILRLGAEVVQVYDTALLLVASAPADQKVAMLARLRAAVNVDLKDSIARGRCHYTGGHGCGVNKGAGDGEMDRIGVPLQQIRQTIRLELRRAGSTPPAPSSGVGQLRSWSALADAADPDTSERAVAGRAA